MRCALILTVGTGTGPDSDIAPPLLKRIRHTRPDRVALLASDGSAPNADRIQAECGLGEAASQERIAQPDEVEYVFRRALSVLRGLRDEGFAPEDVQADYTSGTKAMTAGLVLAAVAFGCSALGYVTGPREHGTVIPGSERFLDIPPAGILAQRDVGLGLELLRRLQFEAVRRMFPGGASRLLDEYDARLVINLRTLAGAYDAWDKFQHGEFNRHYHQADVSLPELLPFRLSGDVVERIQAMHRATRDKDRRKRLLADHLADLWNNARRRLDEGKYDDAVARLYRLAEMIAQYELARSHDVNTADVDPQSLPIPVEYRERLEGQRRRGKVTIGLRDNYELLQALGSPLGADFQRRENMSDLLGKRNASILAHGQDPIAPADAEALAQEVAALAEVAVPDFGSRCADLQFPWLVQAEA